MLGITVRDLVLCCHCIGMLARLHMHCERLPRPVYRLVACAVHLIISLMCFFFHSCHYLNVSEAEDSDEESEAAQVDEVSLPTLEFIPLPDLFRHPRVFSGEADITSPKKKN